MTHAYEESDLGVVYETTMAVFVCSRCELRATTATMMDARLIMRRHQSSCPQARAAQRQSDYIEQTRQAIQEAMEATNRVQRPLDVKAAWLDQTEPNTMPQIVCDTSLPDGDGNVVVSIWDPYMPLREGLRVSVRDENSGEAGFGLIVDCRHERGDDGVERYDLRIKPLA